MHHITAALENRWVAPIAILGSLGMVAAGLATSTQPGALTMIGRLLFLAAALRITYQASTRTEVRRHEVTRSMIVDQHDEL